MEYSSETTPEAIYHQYLETYRVGVFEYIREDVIGPGDDDILPRKYFSGGFTAAQTRKVSTRESSERLLLESRATTGRGALYYVRMKLSEDDESLTDGEYYDGENVGGINLSTNGDFQLDIEREGEGFRFQLSGELNERLQNTSMGRLRPCVVFVRRIDEDQFEASGKSTHGERSAPKSTSSF
jgi:hypothetical protein